MSHVSETAASPATALRPVGAAAVVRAVRFLIWARPGCSTVLILVKSPPTMRASDVVPSDQTPRALLIPGA